MVVEVAGIENCVFLVTIPGPAVGPTLEILRYANPTHNIHEFD